MSIRLKINKPFTTENWCLCVRLVLVQSQFFSFFLKGHHLCLGLILHNTKKRRRNINISWFLWRGADAASVD